MRFVPFSNLRRLPVCAAITAFAFLAAWSVAATPTSPASTGSVEFAGRLAREHWHLFGPERKAEIEALNRDLREASHLFETVSDATARDVERTRLAAAATRLRNLVTEHSRLVRMDLTAARPAFPKMTPIEQPGETGALLFEVNAGGGGHQFSVATRDLAEMPRGNSATLVIVDVAASGVTHAVVGLEHLPVGRTTLLVEFRRPGRGTVRLPLDVTTPEPGRLKLTVLSDDTGKPTPAMVRLTWRTDGRARPPGNAVDFRPQFDSLGVVSAERTAFLPGVHQGSFWCMPEPVDMTLAPGVWEIAVGRGFEHTPVFEKITVEPGQTVEKVIRPRRWVDARQQGWWSGDDHVHAHLTTENDARNLIAWTQAEDVHVTNVLEMGDIYRTYFEQRGFGANHRVQSGDYVLVPAQECPRTGQIGHVLTMNIAGMVRDTDQYFLYDRVFDAVHGQGGLTGYAHAATGMFEAHRDMSLNVPRQKVDFFEILQFNNLGTDLYYEFLNLGCKVTASAGSDLPWGGTIGETRIYSYLGREPFSADAWFKAVGRGRTFTTSGPMLEFTVDEALPGDEVRATPGRPLRVRARAWADPNFPTPVRLEIVRHGEVIRSAVSADPERPEAQLEFTVDPDDGYWIAARARTGHGTSAHTTPVYVVRDGLRFWKYPALEELIQRRIASLTQIEEIVADARRLDGEGRLESDRNRKQLALDGPALLERVASARQMYAELQQTAEQERGRRTPQPAQAMTSDPPGWQLVLEQNFPIAGDFPRWRREGTADVSVTMERMLQVQTRRGFAGAAETNASMLWFDTPVDGDLRIEFDARAEAGTRCNFFFNAQARGSTSSVLDIPRPRARDADYAGDGQLELYAMEILRNDEPTVELSHFAGKETVLQSAPSPFRGDPERVYHFDVRVVGARVTVVVDGQVVFDVTDEARKERPLRGGYFGFRSARPGGLSFDSVRVYRPVGG